MYNKAMESITPQQFWSNVDIYRKRANISWNEMAHSINIAPTNLHNTKLSVPRIPTAMAIAKRLDCTVNDLIQADT